MKKEVFVLITLLVLGSITTMSAIAKPAECGSTDDNGNCLYVPDDGGFWGGVGKVCKKIGEVLICCIPGGCTRVPQSNPTQSCSQLCQGANDYGQCLENCRSSDYCRNSCTGSQNFESCIRDCTAKEDHCKNYCANDAQPPYCQSECMNASPACESHCSESSNKGPCLYACKNNEGACSQICNGNAACTEACLDGQDRNPNCTNYCRDYRAHGYRSAKICFERAAECK